MKLEECEGKIIRVKQRDEFIKYGVLTYVGETEITIQFKDGRSINISRDFISSWEVSE